MSRRDTIKMTKQDSYNGYDIIVQKVHLLQAKDNNIAYQAMKDL